MPSVSPANGPVAVTGASGFIGSWIVHDLLRQGYTVHACVRSKARPDKVDHLLAMHADRDLRGRLELFEGDLNKPGSYDAPFAGCCAVIHAGAALGHNGETPQEVYDMCFTDVKGVLDSVDKAGGTVKRFVFTSSFAAVFDPQPDGYVYTENDWFSQGNPAGWKGKCTDENIPKIRDIAYAFAKMRAEKLVYERAAASNGGFEAMAILPLHVIGPLMASNHDQGWSWQGRIRRMLLNEHPKFRLLWNCVDVRDTAVAHRLCIESNVARNGSRYILAAADRSGELYHWQVAQKLRDLFPMIKDVSGEEMNVDGTPKKITFDRPRSYCLLAKQELGLQSHTIDETLRDTGESMIRLGMLDKQLSARPKL